MFKRIAYVKTAWSELYDGDKVHGDNYRNVKEYGDAYELYNFKEFEGKFYAYIPPIGQHESTPQPKEKSDWLIIFTAMSPDNDGIKVVGWYSNAIFHDKYIERPEYKNNKRFKKDSANNKFKYCISANRAQLIPENERKIKIPGKHFGSTPVIYVKGTGNDNEDWRIKLAEIAENLVANQYQARENIAADNNIEIDEKSYLYDYDLRKKVEISSVFASKNI